MGDIIRMLTFALLLPLAALAIASQQAHGKEPPDKHSGKEQKRHDTGAT